MNDLIRRQEAITIPVLPKEHRKYQTMNLDDAYELGWFDCQKCIEYLPSAQPERKKGKWIPYEFGSERWHKCTACGKADEYINERGLEARREFCPHCGAQMEVRK